MESEPEKFFTTPHYDGHPTVLVRFGAVDERELESSSPNRGASVRRRSSCRRSTSRVTRPTRSRRPSCLAGGRRQVARSGSATQTSHSRPSGSRKKRLRMGPKSVTKPSVLPRSIRRRRISSNASSDAACRREVVDPSSPEHGRLAVGLGVAVDLEDVELGRRPDVDERQPHAGPLRRVSRHRRVEHVDVEGVQTVGVVGDDGNVVEAVHEHSSSSMSNHSSMRASGSPL